MNNEFWETRYAEPGFAYGTQPNAFLAAQREQLRPGMRALAVADGEGRNGVWLAQQGLDVLSVDASAVGMRKAAELAAQAGVALATECTDLASWDWPQQAFDLVISIYVHFPPELRPRLHRAMLQSLRPGGMLVMEAFNLEQLAYPSGGPRVQEMLYSADMLAEDFAGAGILQLEELVTDLNEGKYHCGPGAVVRLIAQRTVA